MAFTKVTNAGIGSTNTVLLHNLNVVGTVTATNGIFSGIGSFGGNVTVGGVLTYEDVTNVDSVGLITARKGINVLGAGVTIAAGGLNVNAGVSTFGGNVTVGSGITLSPDGNGFFTGIITATTFSGVDTDKISEGNTEVETVDTGSDGHVKITTEGTERLRIISDGKVGIGTAVPDQNLEIHQQSGTNLVKLSTHANSTVGLEIEKTGATTQSWRIADGQTSNGSLEFYDVTDSATRLLINGSGKIGIGENSPDEILHINSGTSNGCLKLESTDSQADLYIVDSGGQVAISAVGDNLLFQNTGSQTERLRIDSSGRILAGVTASRSVGTATAHKLQVEAVDATAGVTVTRCNAGTTGPYLSFGKSRAGSLGDNTVVQSGDSLGMIRFAGADGTDTQNVGAQIQALVDGTPGTDDMPGRLIFSTTADGANTSTERLAISSTGEVKITGGTTSRALKVNCTHTSGGELVCFDNGVNNHYGALIVSAGEIDRECRLEAAYGNSLMTFWTQDSTAYERMRITHAGNVTTCGESSFDRTTAGVTMRKGDALNTTRSNGCPFEVNRQSGDGALVIFYESNSSEGSINVSGSSVSYNGGVLSRWSQLVGISTNVKSDRPTIYRGTVMSNLDEMCEWTGEDNQQLNKTKVSTASGDKDVAGVFWGWDDDDDTYTNDFYIAQTGDFIVRVAGSTTVARGDLLESAGDGTAKPQSDDIVRSKTIAKIISTTSTATYADGSKAYPCVLMAC